MLLINIANQFDCFHGSHFHYLDVLIKANNSTLVGEDRDDLTATGDQRVSDPPLETVESLLGVDLRPLLAQALDRGVKAVTLVVLPPLG